MKEMIKIGIIGCGGMAGAHLGGLKDLKEEGVDKFEVVAICDVDEEQVKKFAKVCEEKLSITPLCFTNYEEMLSKVELDAVDIVTPHQSHHRIALDCLSSKKHIFIEKPLAIVPSLGREMISSAKDKGLKLAVAEDYRLSPGNIAVKKMIEEGLIGKPYFTTKAYGGVGSGIFCGTPWRHMKEMGGAGVIFDNGVHDADLFLYWLGDIDEVFSYNKIFEKKRSDENREIFPTSEDTDATILKFKGGALGHWLCSWAAHGKDFHYCLIYGSKGRISLAPFEVNLDDGTKLEGEEIVSRYAEGIRKNGVATELEAFAVSIIEDKEPAVGGEQALKAMAVSFAALESAMTHQPVKVENILEGKAKVYEESVIMADDEQSIVHGP